jgi:pantoate--beta-alanine ligase
LHRALQAAEKLLAAGNRDALSLQHAIRRVLETEPKATVDYVEIVDAETLQPVAHVSRPAYALLAAKFGAARLLDNLLIDFKEPGREETAFTEL